MVDKSDTLEDNNKQQESREEQSYLNTITLDSSKRNRGSFRVPEFSTVIKERLAELATKQRLVENSVHFLKKAITFVQGKKKLLIPFLCMMIPILLTVWFQSYPAYLPATDDLAKETVRDLYTEKLTQEVNEQFPLLPEQNKKLLVEQELQNILLTRQKEVELQKKQLSQLMKDYFQDDRGQTYLQANDPYLWYGEARNYLTYGHLGDTIINGTSIYSLRNGRFGKEPSRVLHPYAGAYWHTFLRIFNNDISLMTSVFWFPVFIQALAIIPLFFLTRKIAGNIGGLFAGTVLALNSYLVARTAGGIFDTDGYSILFPLLIGWVFVESWLAQNQKRRLFYSFLCGALIGIYATAWTGWWFTFLLLVATMGGMMLLSVYSSYQKIKEKELSLIAVLKNDALFLLIFAVTSGILVDLLLYQKQFEFSKIVLAPLRFFARGEEVTASLWPSVFKSVAEFSGAGVPKILSWLGGTTLVALALLGMILLLTMEEQKEKKKLYSLLLILWIIPTFYAATTGERFIVLLVPAFALAVGIGVGKLYDKVPVVSRSMHLPALLVKLMLLILFIALFSAPTVQAHRMAKTLVPNMNDAWYTVLTAIKNDSPPNAIITSWWDYGYNIMAIAERTVTFDSGDQGERIHWVGKLLLTDNEKEAVGILRMLNCGQEQAPHVLERYFNGDTVKAMDILNQIIVLNKKEAEVFLHKERLNESAITELFQTTHCDDLRPQYFITSEDMAAKSITWGHYGLWDFTKAKVYQEVKKRNRPEAIAYLQSALNLSNGDAQDTYLEMINKKEEWIANKPQYWTRPRPCKNENEVLTCQVPVNGENTLFTIHLGNMTTILTDPNGQPIQPFSLVYASERGVEEKRFSGTTALLSIVLLNDKGKYSTFMSDPLLAMSLFTKLYFFEGSGLQCFQKLSSEVDRIGGGTITAWKVDWDCLQENKITQ